MGLLGAEVRAVTAGTATLKDAMNEAIRDWIANVEDTHYLIGSAAGPHPYPAARARAAGGDLAARRAPSCSSARTGCPTRSSPASAAARTRSAPSTPFRDDPVRLIGVEAGGDGGEHHAASIGGGKVSVLHGSRSYVLCDEHGQVVESHSISAGLDYPGVGPEHAFLAETGPRRVRARASDAEALESFHRLCRLEGIIPALESAHALSTAEQLARELGPDGARARVPLGPRATRTSTPSSGLDA